MISSFSCLGGFSGTVEFFPCDS
uniref:Uncharacterized protein n=1 Tax=Rhizophora mucronata TaxID=61149 RepID=A0A2P2NH41_RHIMU